MNPMNWWWRWKFLADPFYDNIGRNTTVGNASASIGTLTNTAVPTIYVCIYVFGTILVVGLAAIFIGGMLLSNIRTSTPLKS